mgnify:CR=1 FL=1
MCKEFKTSLPDIVSIHRVCTLHIETTLNYQPSAPINGLNLSAIGSIFNNHLLQHIYDCFAFLYIICLAILILVLRRVRVWKLTTYIDIQCLPPSGTDTEQVVE